VGVAKSLELWRPVADGAHEILPDRKCPRCGAARTHRSRIRGFMEGTLKAVTPLRPFTCSSCHWRGWRVPVASSGPTIDLPPLSADRRRTTRADKRHIEHMSGAEIMRRKQRIQVVVAMIMAVLTGIIIMKCESS
jgi:hypothetical protein